MCEFNRKQPGGQHCLLCIIFNTTLNPLLFTGGLGLIKSWCVSIWSRARYARVWLLSVNKRKINIHQNKGWRRCYIFYYLDLATADLQQSEKRNIYYNTEGEEKTPCFPQSSLTNGLRVASVVLCSMCAVPVGVAAFLLTVMINETACGGCDT